VGGIKFNNIIANPVVENMTVPASGQWEGHCVEGLPGKSSLGFPETFQVYGTGRFQGEIF